MKYIFLLSSLLLPSLSLADAPKFKTAAETFAENKIEVWQPLEADRYCAAYVPDENGSDETTELIFFSDRMTACHSIDQKNGAGTQNIHVDSGGAIPWAECYAGFRERVLNVVPKEQLGKAKKLVPADEKAFRSVSGELVYRTLPENQLDSARVKCGDLQTVK